MGEASRIQDAESNDRLLSAVEGDGYALDADKRGLGGFPGRTDIRYKDHPLDAQRPKAVHNGTFQSETEWTTDRGLAARSDGGDRRNWK